MSSPARQPKLIEGRREIEYITEADVEEATDQIGIGPFHWYVYLIVGLFTAADSVEIGFVSFVTEVLKEEWGIEESTKATLEAMVFVGQLAGAPTWGWLADRFGRRNVMLLSALEVSAAGFLTACATNANFLIIIRFMVGFGVSGCVVAFDIFAECLPTDWRGGLCMSTFYWFTLGSLYSNLAAKLFLCSQGWQFYTVICALPTFVAAIAGYFLVPESAHWLVAEGRNQDAADVLNGIAEMNGALVRFESLTQPEVLEDFGTRDLCRRSKLRKPLVWMSLTWLGFGLAYYGIALLLPHLFSQHGDEGEACPSGEHLAFNQGVTRKKQNATLVGGHCLPSEDSCIPDKANCFCIEFGFTDIVISNAGQCIGLTAGVLAVDRLGRVRTQQLLYLVGALFAVGLGFPGLNHALLTIFSTVSLAAINGASSCTWAHTPEIFPTHARVLATGICSAVARFGAAASPYVISDMVPPLPTALIMAAFSLLSAVSISAVKETSGAHIDNEDIESSEDEQENDADPLE